VLGRDADLDVKFGTAPEMAYHGAELDGLGPCPENK
jgi:hypothetical protein